MGKVGMRFASPYLFYQTFQQLARVKSLKIDSDSYRKEFEHIRALKIRPTMERIEKYILPLVRQLRSSIPRKLTEDAILELKHHNAELGGLLRNIHERYQVAKDMQKTSFENAVGFFLPCAGLLLLANPLVAAPLCLPSALSTLIYQSSTSTLEQLAILGSEVEMSRHEIEDLIPILEELIATVYENETPLVVKIFCAYGIILTYFLFYRNVGHR